ncbi:MAG: hypothetical protein LBN95_05040 [Prevotellaceae bacterium]|jgi:hypothetical protein|nr:hypothetical protein [Prevotellaceae bacterium]
MKKILKFIALIALCSVVLFSCEKNKTLVGTSWKNIWTNGDVLIISFTTETDCTNKSYSKTYNFTDFDYGTYVYNQPNIAIDFHDGDDELVGTVKGNKMTLSIDGITIVYTKQ